MSAVSDGIPSRFYAAAAVIAVQALALYSLPSIPSRPLVAPLMSLPASLKTWIGVRDLQLDSTALEMLKADDTLSRDYFDPSRNASANLFIAYFGAQTEGRWPHSPQHCMPGAGWEPLSLSRVLVSIPSRPEPLRINRYLLTRDKHRVVVHYWYQSQHQVIASEYMAKIYLVMDSIRYRRSDTALVRVTTRVLEDGPPEPAIEDGMRFVQACFGPVQAILN